MKNIVLLLVFFLAANDILAQEPNTIYGNYSIELGNEQHHIKYEISLNSNGSFDFHSYSKVEGGIPPETHVYGKGNWNLEGKIVSFVTDEEKDLNEKYTLDFNNTRARFITKPPRDKTARVLKTQLKFFESKIFWIKGLNIYKI